MYDNVSVQVNKTENCEKSEIPANKTIEELLTRDQHAVIVTYWVLMTLGAFCNLAVLLSLTRTRRRKSRVDLLMTHLAIADVLVTCGVIPLESLVFRVMQHPLVPEFEQCVSFGAFSNAAQEIAYNVACLCAMYFVPLLIISVCYICIFCRIRRCTNELDDNCIHNNERISGDRLRRSDHRLLERAKRRTLRMTLIIVTVFAFCWLPYAVMTMWYMVDRSSASRVSPQLQDMLFAMAVSNSCMNPIVYGSYALRSNETIQELLKKTCCWLTSPTMDTGNTGLTTHKNKLRNIDDPTMKSNKSVNPQTRLGVRFAETPLVEAQRARESRAARARASRPPPRLRCAPHERQRALLQCRAASEPLV
ncbi:unnamed protein product [Parnassius apollo]|uniref:(apollo) hypothetical protein n=1 Tax=Parnassius apollo TaxID=110799 RepID=A0A8S3YBI7_PARAO|nr:unnamed protein product [Parnassius apollo]